MSPGRLRSLRGLRGSFQNVVKWRPEMKLPAQLAKARPVPHKNAPNDTFELFWKFGRYVCQLKRLEINYCSQGGSSRGIRYFIDTELEKFVEENPEVAVYVRERKRHAPRLVANYLNENDRIIQVPNHDILAIRTWLNRLRDESGRKWGSERVYQTWITNTPSMQGTWTPFLFKPPIDINHRNYIDLDKYITK